MLEPRVEAALSAVATCLQRSFHPNPVYLHLPPGRIGSAPWGSLKDAVFDETTEDRQGSVSAFDRCHSRQKRCGRDDLKKSVLSRSVLGRINESYLNGEFRTSICGRNCTPKKTGPKRIFSATLNVAVFDDNSTDRKLTLSPIDPFQSRQKRRCRDLYTKLRNLCFSPFF